MTDNLKNIGDVEEENFSHKVDFLETQGIFEKIQAAEEGKLTRHWIRNLLFKLRDRRVFPEEKAQAKTVFDIFQKQFEPGTGLDDFTFTWDVGVDNPLRLIREDEWEDAGGTYDEELAKKNAKVKRPAAFTKQK